MTLSAFGITDKGVVRSGNEDALLLEEDLGLFAVADGMGGHRGGEVASRMALDVLRDYISRVASGSGAFIGAVDNDFSRQANLLASGIRLANRAVFEAADSSPAWRGMGTTIVALLIDGARAAVAHAGDSRLYLLRERQLRQVTGDHSLVADQLRQGVITAEQAAASDRKNIITRALGQWQELEIEIQDLELQDGDRLLLCSDGLSGMVSDPETAALLVAHPAPEDACRALVEVANSYGGRDNITVLLVDYRSGNSLMAGLKRIFNR